MWQDKDKQSKEAQADTRLPHDQKKLLQFFGDKYTKKMRNAITAALTHDGHLVQRPVRLPRLRPRNKIPQSDGAQRDETEVDPIQERPGHLHRAEHGRRRNKEEQQHQNHQQHKVDDGGRTRLHPRTVQEADGSEDQRVHEPLDAGGEHQHGEGYADQSIEDGEGFPSVGQRSGVTITWRLMKKTEGDIKHF